MSATRPSQSLSHDGQTLRMARSNISACRRCRQKKKKCDGTLPKCSLCQIAGAECVSWDAVAQRQVPRSYVQSLEERVAYLELKLQDYGVLELEGASPTPSTRTASYGPEHVNTMDRIMSMTERKPGREEAFSRNLLNEMVKLNPSRRPTRIGPTCHAEEHVSPEAIVDLDTSPVSLPTREGAQGLVRAYFRFANLSLPLLHEQMFRKRLEHVFTISQSDQDPDGLGAEDKIALFFVFEVFAVALLTLQKHDPSRIPVSLADRYHRTALKALTEAGLPNGLEGVQALLLLAQYSYHHPTVWDVWKTVGAALRLAVELGLHQDPSAESSDYLTLDTRRRTFWVAYAMDRNISIALGLPSCLADGAITVEFPSSTNDDQITEEGILISDPAGHQPKVISLHVLKYRQIQSEMQTMLYERRYPAYDPVNLIQWQEHMAERIRTWLANTPSSKNSDTDEKRVLENFELTFHRGLFYLYHPSLNIPTPSEQALVTLADAATNMIQLYRRFFPERRLTIYWQAVENLYAAGTGLMYSYVNSSQVQASLSLRSLESLVHSCSSVLWGMVEHFPDFKGRRDAFDLAASKVLADLNANNSPAAQHSLSAGTATSLPPGLWPTSFSNTDAQSIHNQGAPSRISPIGLPADVATNIPVVAAPFLFSDFDDVSFDWQSLDNMNEVFSPS